MGSWEAVGRSVNALEPAVIPRIQLTASHPPPLDYRPQKRSFRSRLRFGLAVYGSFATLMASLLDCGNRSLRSQRFFGFRPRGLLAIRFAHGKLCRVQSVRYAHGDARPPSASRFMGHSLTLMAFWSGWGRLLRSRWRFGLWLTGLAVSFAGHWARIRKLLYLSSVKSSSNNSFGKNTYCFKHQ